MEPFRRFASPPRSPSLASSFSTPARLGGASVAAPPPLKRSKPARPASPGLGGASVASPAPPPLKRDKPTPPTPTSTTHTPRGLPAEQPALWARVFFTPEGAGGDTQAESMVLSHIEDNYEIPSSLPVPLSGLTGEERLRAAYYQGLLCLKAGRAAVVLCSTCGGEGHTPSRCV